MLYHRYANPMELLAVALRQCRFTDTICQIYGESSRQQCWEFFLHCVRDKTFSEFMAELESKQPAPAAANAKAKDVIQKNLHRFEHLQIGRETESY